MTTDAEFLRRLRRFQRTPMTPPAGAAEVGDETREKKGVKLEIVKD